MLLDHETKKTAQNVPTDAIEWSVLTVSECLTVDFSFKVAATEKSGVDVKLFTSLSSVAAPVHWLPVNITAAWSVALCDLMY